MSLWIDVDKVVAVLLADGWHDVDNNSFALDAYEYHWQERPMHMGGHSGICATGFSFTVHPGGYQFVGPLSSILAIKRRL